MTPTNTLAPQEDTLEKTVSAVTAPRALSKGASLYGKNHFVTEGERKFDFRAYNLIGYILNAAISVVAVWLVDRTATGQRWLNASSNFLGEKLKVSPDTVKFFATKTFFLTGGFAVLAPVKWMEDRKAQLVRKWNREIYGARADTDARILQSEKEIEEAPKQNWASIGWSRALALVPFYLGYWLIWERKSPLSKVTNPDATFRQMSSEQMKTMEQSGDLNEQAKFSELAQKGLYVDRPIAYVSRRLGDGIAKLTGNTEARAQINEMKRIYPGMVKAGIPSDTNKDPVHTALPYYIISESITSGMVAAGVYLLTRVLGPILGTKDDKKKSAKNEKPIPASKAANANEPPAVNDNALLKKEDRPHAVVNGSIEHRGQQAAAGAGLNHA